jgi:hypothetical protein
MAATPPGLPYGSTFTPREQKLNGLGALVQDILIGVGLMDPINHYEPELANNLPAVYSKYADQVARYSIEVRGLRSGSAQRELAGRLQGLARQADSLRPAYTIEGSRPGKRERDKLGELVKGVRDFRSDFSTAKKKFGWNPVAVENPETGDPVIIPQGPPVAPQAVAEELPWGPILAGAAILFIASRK